MKKTMYTVVIINLTLLLAQPTFPNKPNQAPIGGIGILAAAGGVLALKKLWQKKEKLNCFILLNMPFIKNIY